MKTFDVVAWIFLLAGAINWGLVGAFDFNLVAAIFGPFTVFSRIVYILVGLAAVYELIALRAQPRRWAERGLFERTAGAAR